ncbi:hypothetical protein RGC28_07450, partial [Helicobacter pylori]|nr:hypothetical protein [Helicobacter pylori]
HNNPSTLYRDLHDPLVSIDDLRVNYEHLLQNASPLLELSQNTTFKIYRKAYQKSLPLLRAIRRWVKKVRRLLRLIKKLERYFKMR